MSDKVKAFLLSGAIFLFYGAMLFGPSIISSIGGNDSPATDSVHEALEPTCEEQQIDYEEVEQETDQLEVGDSEVIQDGVEGTRLICTDPQTNETVSNEVTKEPISKIIRIGTYEDPVYTTPAYGSICNDGTWSPSTGRGTCSWHDGVWYYL